MSGNGEQTNVLHRNHSRLRRITISLVLLAIFSRTLLAQSDGDKKKALTLPEAVDFALKNYPAVRVALERVAAAQAGIGLARTNYLPRADLLWQTTRATDNNITGLLLPQSIVSPITGAVHRIAAESKCVGKPSPESQGGAKRFSEQLCTTPKLVQPIGAHHDC